MKEKILGGVRRGGSILNETFNPIHNARAIGLVYDQSFDGWHREGETTYKAINRNSGPGILNKYFISPVKGFYDEASQLPTQGINLVYGFYDRIIGGSKTEEKRLRPGKKLLMKFIICG
ncbi:MAG: hypothetical protein JW727_05660 [Candidatus Aenigmarchaeota archaeon]|nr:hypothetical protein [Candidatus Aenigmarchaeota archaeon]